MVSRSGPIATKVGVLEAPWAIAASAHRRLWEWALARMSSRPRLFPACSTGTRVPAEAPGPGVASLAHQHAPGALQLLVG